MNLAWQPPSFVTPRLRLRPLTVADAPSVFLYACNPQMTSYTLWETHEDLDDSTWFVQDYAHSRYVNHEPDPLGITLGDDVVIGTIGCFWADQLHATLELGYSLAEPYWGRGYIVEAARPLIDYVFENMPVERLQARVFAGNNASERVLQKLGFTREGVLRSRIQRRGRAWDIVMYSLLRSEWQRGSSCFGSSV